MNLKKILFIYFSFFVFSTHAKQIETGNAIELFIQNETTYIEHIVSAKEDIYSIASIYNVPTIVLCQHNNITINDTLNPKQKLLIPIGRYNFHKEEPSNVTYKQLYIKNGTKEKMAQVANALKFESFYYTIWNPRVDNNNNTNLLSGWVTFKPSNISNIKVSEIAPLSNQITSTQINSTNKFEDTSISKPSELEMIYNYQTTNEAWKDSSSGMVVFFKPQTNMNNDMLFAFSNEIPKGKVVKIVNPTNKKFAFAKVIGSLPGTKQYMNARLGVDGRARAILETREVKLWCDYFLKY
jgi:hypothetical protein